MVRRFLHEPCSLEHKSDVLCVDSMGRTLPYDTAYRNAVDVAFAVEGMKGCDNVGSMYHRGFKFPHLFESLPRATFATI